MEIFPVNRYYALCMHTAVIYGNTYEAGVLYMCDEVYYYTGSYYEMYNISGVFIGHADEWQFDRYFKFITKALNEVDELFNKMMNG